MIGRVTALDHDAGKLHPRVDIELLLDLPEVEIDGVPREEQSRRGFPVRQAFGDESRETELVVGQAVPPEDRTACAFLPSAIWIAVRWS